MATRKQVIFIEGNISSSKTTILRGCREAGFAVFEEPLDVWKERYVEKDGQNILGLFYADTPRWAFTFEVGVMHTRFFQLLEALKHSDATVIVERSLYTDGRVFAPEAYAAGNMTSMEWKLYTDWYNCFMKCTVEPILAECDIEFIFIDTPPEICFQRKTIRDRKEESAVVPSYFGNLHDRHEKWLLDPDMPHRVQVVDGSKTQPEVLKQVLKCVKVCVTSPLKTSIEGGRKIWQEVVQEYRVSPRAEDLLIAKPFPPKVIGRKKPLERVSKEAHSSDDEYHDDVTIALPFVGPRTVDTMHPVIPTDSRPACSESLQEHLNVVAAHVTGC